MEGITLKVVADTGSAKRSVDDLLTGIKQRTGGDLLSNLNSKLAAAAGTTTRTLSGALTGAAGAARTFGDAMLRVGATVYVREIGPGDLWHRARATFHDEIAHRRGRSVPSIRVVNFVVARDAGAGDGEGVR